MTQNQNQTQTEQTIHEPEVEVILNGEKSEAEKQFEAEEGMTEAQRVAKKMVDGFEQTIDSKIDELGLETGDEVEAQFVDMNELQSKFDSLIQQSTDHGNQISETIRVSDLGEESTELLIDGYKQIEKIHTDKTMTEKVIDKVPVPFLRKKLKDGFRVAELESKRNQSVREYAQDHFDALQRQKDHVNSNRIAVDEIRQKLEQSDELLEDMLIEARQGLADIEARGGDKAQEIKGKELMLNIGTQITAQRKIIEQAEMFESVASIVSEKITSTLPQIKDQFINQVSVTASLKNLANLQQSVEATKDMVLNMQNEVLDQANDVFDKYRETGLGESKEQKKLRKQADQKMSALRQKREGLRQEHAKDVSDRWDEVERDLIESKKHIGNKNL